MQHDATAISQSFAAAPCGSYLQICSSSSFHEPTIWASNDFRVQLVTTSSAPAIQQTWWNDVWGFNTSQPSVLWRPVLPAAFPIPSHKGTFVWNTFPPEASLWLLTYPANTASITSASSPPPVHNFLWQRKLPPPSTGWSVYASAQHRPHCSHQG